MNKQNFSQALLSLMLPLCLAGGCVVSACGGRSTAKTIKETPVLPPVNPQAVKKFNAGVRLLKRGKVKAGYRGVALLEEAVALDANLWEAYHNMGAFYLRNGEFSKADRSFASALAINPVHQESLAGRAEANRSLENTKTAAKLYRSLLDLSPNSIATYSRLAALYREKEDYEKALGVLRNGLRVAGNNSTIYAELGLVYLGQGKDELAELVLQKSIALDNTNPSVFNALALVALGKGDDQLAFSYFDSAAELDPNYMDARFNKASILLDSGDYERARVELEAITASNPEDMEVQVALGVAYRGLAKLDVAQKTWEHVAKNTSKKSKVRLDALFNLAILQMDFIMDDSKAKLALDRYLQDSNKRHPNYEEAMEYRKDLGQ